MAVPFADQRDEVERTIRSATRIWLGLDFDGTLVRFECRPENVQLSHQSRSLLRTLAGHPRMSVAVVSGRALHDVRERVNLDCISYSGNHGLEIWGADVDYDDQTALEMREALAAMSEEIGNRLADVPHVLIEDKRLTLSVHYRQVDPEAWVQVHEAVEAVVSKQSTFRLTGGAKVWEVRPNIAASKGTAALWLKRQHGGPQALPIFIGDDLTDEDAFRMFPNGVTVLVGANRPSAAKYLVSSHEEVHEFLLWVATILTKPLSNTDSSQRTELMVTPDHEKIPGISSPN